MAGIAVVDGAAGAHLLGKGGLDEGQVHVLLVAEALEQAGRFFEGFAELLLGDAMGGGAFDDYVAVNAAEIETAREALRQRLAAAEGAPGDSDNGHGGWGTL